MLKNSISSVSVKGITDAADINNNILKSNKMKFDDYSPDTLKPSVAFRPPAELGNDIPFGR